jgi:predicted AAA+ superfamily ATPase
MLDRPMVLFFDEVQYDPTWGITLKTLYDRTDKVFVISTGSAALMLNTNADIARRTVFEKMLPLSFTEYLKITKEKYEIRGLGSKIQEALWSSHDAKESYDRLLALSPSINEYYTGVMRTDYQRYLWYGSLPHMVDYGDEAIVYEQIQKTLDRIIHSDLPMVKFHPDTVSIIPAILYALADMDSCNVSKMVQKFDLSRPKIEAVLDALEGAELLRRVYPHGSHLNQVTIRKPSKYLFSAPAFRAVYFRLTSNIISDENAKGKITEDLVGMYISKIFERTGRGGLTYDSAQGGADFILHLSEKTIVIEV